MTGYRQTLKTIASGRRIIPGYHHTGVTVETNTQFDLVVYSIWSRMDKIELSASTMPRCQEPK